MILILFYYSNIKVINVVIFISFELYFNSVFSFRMYVGEIVDKLWYILMDVKINVLKVNGGFFMID